MEQSSERIRYHYIKSSAFRVVYAEGVYGGLSPRGKVALSFFNERLPIPQLTENEILREGGIVRVGAEVNKVGREGLVREVETCVMIDLDTAEIVRDWLSARLLEARKLEGEAETRVESNV